MTMAKQVVNALPVGHVISGRALILQFHLARGIRHEMAFQTPWSTKALGEAISLWSHLTF